ncbi:hypothetical protein ACI65C_004201 [Semiaphis heraclei]
MEIQKIIDIGYVQIKREGSICDVKTQISPEHRVRNKNYHVSLTINEEKEEIVDLHCDDCAASLGGCKHSLAFLMFVHRKSEEKSPTEVECYWKRPKLSGVGTTLKYITAKSMSKKAIVNIQSEISNKNFFNEAMKLGETHQINCQVGAHNYKLEESFFKMLSIHTAILEFSKQYNSNDTVDDFLHFLKERTPISVFSGVEEKTTNQANNFLWFELRYGRITASKIYELSRCKKGDGVLVKQIFGCRKIKLTSAMERGKLLEKDVLQEVRKIVKRTIRETGLAISSDFPIIGASADGLASDFVLEIKCPQKHTTMNNYIKNGIIQSKVLAQLQLQMHVLKKPRGLLATADPDFTQNKKVHISWIDYNKNMCDDLVKKSWTFWKTFIFPILINT